MVDEFSKKKKKRKTSFNECGSQSSLEALLKSVLLKCTENIHSFERGNILRYFLFFVLE